MQILLADNQPQVRFGLNVLLVARRLSKSGVLPGCIDNADLFARLAKWMQVLVCHL